MERLLYIHPDRRNHPGSQLVTLDDLEKFRIKLLMDMKMMLEGHLGKTPKRWLKSYEVRELLKISSGTLCSLRSNGKIPFTRIGGLIYYDAVEIDRVLQVQKRTS